MKVRNAALAGLTLVSLAVAGAALAQNQSVIDERKKLFKEIDVGADDIDDMLRGKKKFDLAYVQKALQTWVDHAGRLPALFPDDSRTGKTRATPKVWEDRTKFNALFDTFGRNSAAAAKTIVDAASAREAMPKLFGDCKTCHDDFRAKKR